MLAVDCMTNITILIDEGEFMEIDIVYQEYDTKYTAVSFFRNGKNICFEFGMCAFEEHMEYYDMLTSLVTYNGQECFLFDKEIPQTDLLLEFEGFILRYELGEVGRIYHKTQLVGCSRGKYQPSGNEPVSSKAAIPKRSLKYRTDKEGRTQIYGNRVALAKTSKPAKFKTSVKVFVNDQSKKTAMVKNELMNE